MTDGRERRKAIEETRWCSRCGKGFPMSWGRCPFCGHSVLED